MVSEQEIIEKLAAFSSGYIGDDAAILPAVKSSRYVISKDLLVEGVHFETAVFSAQDLAHKSLHVNLSDLAATGAKPVFILCGICIPVALQSYAESFLLDLAQLCLQHQVVLIGGDTTAAPSQLTISITAVGVSSGCVYRSTAQHSQVICVAGNLGYAHLGFLGEAFRDYFLRPTARVAEGIWLAETGLVRSMMDVSDGLWVDLRKLCHASGVSAVIELEKLADGFVQECQQLAVDPLETALVGGEDYALLLTVDESDYLDLATRFQAKFGYSLQRIGRTGVSDGGPVLCATGVDPSTLQVFTHFGEDDAS